MGANLVAKRNDLKGKQDILFAIRQEAGADNDLDLVKGGLGQGDTDAKISQLFQLNDELNALVDEVTELDKVEGVFAEAESRQKSLNEPARSNTRHPEEGGSEAAPMAKSLGRLYIESKGYKAFVGEKGQSQWGIKTELPIDLKTLFRTGAGWAPESVRLPRVELDPQRPIAIIDMIPQLNTGLDTIRYMLETTFDSANVVEKAEATSQADANLIGEAELVLTEQTQVVEWLPVFLPMTEQQMEDVEGVEDYVNARLQYMIRARLDLQILRGSGATPLLLGTNNVVGINVQAKGIDPTPDAIYKGIDLCRTVGFAEPSVIFMHPTDWQAIRLLRTADGIYILGAPTEAVTPRLWGLPVVPSTAVVQNTATLGDYRNYSALYTKRGMTMSATDSHGYGFTRGILTIKADMRIAMVHFRPEAFCTVTGI